MNLKKVFGTYSRIYYIQMKLIGLFPQKSSRLVWGKSPRFFPPSPPRNTGFFGDFPPKNPQRLSLPRPQSIPKPFRGSIPVPIPVFWGFSGIEPQKNSKSNPSLSPKNPQNFPKPCPRPRSVPKIWGWGRGNSGIPPYYSQI